MDVDAPKPPLAELHVTEYGGGAELLADIREEDVRHLLLLAEEIPAEEALRVVDPPQLPVVVGKPSSAYTFVVHVGVVVEKELW